METVRNMAAFDLLLDACEAYYYGREEARVCEAMMRHAIAVARPQRTDERVALAIIMHRQCGRSVRPELGFDDQTPPREMAQILGRAIAICNDTAARFAAPLGFADRLAFAEGLGAATLAPLREAQKGGG